MTNFLGLTLNVQNIPELDPGFLPLSKFVEAFRKSVGENGQLVKVAVERENGQIAAFDLRIHGTDEMFPADLVYVERYLKTVLWGCGGFKIYIGGNDAIAAEIKKAYAIGGTREFDAVNMSQIYEKPFEVICTSLEQMPASRASLRVLVGTSTAAVSALMRAEATARYLQLSTAKLFGVRKWSGIPKTNADPDYHFQGIVAAMKSAAAKMPQVDAIGVSSAGIYVNNRTMLASLFLKVPKEAFDAKVKDIYVRSGKGNWRRPP